MFTLLVRIGEDKGGKPTLFSAKAKESEALFLKVSLYEYLLPVLEKNIYLLVL